MSIKVEPNAMVQANRVANEPFSISFNRSFQGRDRNAK
jgi:hypothetical protein